LFEVDVQPFFNLKNFVKNRIGRYSSQYVDCFFQSAKKLNHEILGWLDKSKIPGHCGFPLANPQYGSSLDFVPDDNIG
jgi:hypothetical protein